MYALRLLVQTELAVYVARQLEAVVNGKNVEQLKYWLIRQNCL